MSHNEVLVADLYVQCSYPMRPDAITASDNCRGPASTAVQDAGGNSWWRCPVHEGRLADGTPGKVVASVPRHSAPLPPS